MKRLDDGSVTLTKLEAEKLATLLDLATELAGQMDAGEQPASTVEFQVKATVDYLEDLGVSSEELTGRLDSRPRSR